MTTGESVPAAPGGSTPSPVVTAIGSRESGATAADLHWRTGFRRLIGQTVATCFRYRVTGLAAEAGFFALLSLPPLILGLFGTLGYLAPVVSDATVDHVRSEIIRLASLALSDQSVRDVIVPTLDDVLNRGRPDIISVGFLLSLWSGSRAVNVYVDTVTIMYGLGGRRGIIKQRSMSFGLYLIGLLAGVVFFPIVLAGPTLVDRALPERFDPLNALYWPVVVVFLLLFLATLYHVSIPVRTRWRRALPGALLALTLLVLLSYFLRWIISISVGGESIYGPLASPIVIMLWLYLIAITVLIGAAMNAAADRIWPAGTTTAARQEERRKLEGLRAARKGDDDTAVIRLRAEG